MRATISKNKTKPVSNKKKFIDPFIQDVIAKLSLGKIETMQKNIEDFEKDMETIIAQLDIIKKKLKSVQLEKSKPEVLSSMSLLGLNSDTPANLHRV
jgi:hypothetical protein